MRRILLLLALASFASSLALAQTSVSSVNFIHNGKGNAVARCLREHLSVKEGETDAAMGGVRLTDYAFTNTSSKPCALGGYPRVELLNRRGRVVRRAVRSAEMPGDSERRRPELVTLEPGQTAWFSIHYNSGGAGHIGKPCPTYPRVKITAPGTKRAFLLRSEIQSCGRTEFLVSAVRNEMPRSGRAPTGTNPSTESIGFVSMMPGKGALAQASTHSP